MREVRALKGEMLHAGGARYCRAVADDGKGVRRIKLVGARFDGGRLPVDSLIELQRFQQLLRLLARSEWKADHPNEPLPDGFDEELSLTIEDIKPGSADIFLAFEQRAIYAAYQEQARDSLDEVILAAYSARDLPPMPNEVADEVRQRLADFGDTLESSQAIELFVHGADAAPIEVTVDSHKKLLDTLALEGFLLEPQAGEAQGVLTKREETVVGRITEVDAEKATFRFESLQHGRLIGHYESNPGLIDDIREVLDSAEEAPVLRVAGELQYRRDGKPWRFTETHLVEQFAAGSGPWAARLVEFAELPAHWGDEGGGSPIAIIALEAAAKVLDALEVAGSEPPGLFPTEEGGVILEWASQSIVRSVEVTADAEFELFVMPAGGPASLRMTSNLMEAIRFSRGES